MAARPAGIGALDQLVDRLGRPVVAEHVATHVRRPRPPGVVVDPDADGVAQPDHVRAEARGRQRLDGGAAVVLLLAHVAGGADGQEDRPVAQDLDGLRAVAADGEVPVEDGAIGLHESIERNGVERRLSSDEEITSEAELDVVSAAVAGSDLDHLVGATVTVRVRKCDHSVRSSLGHVQDALRRDSHEPRAGQPAGEDRCLEPVRDDKRRLTAAGQVEADAKKPAEDLVPKEQGAATQHE